MKKYFYILLSFFIFLFAGTAAYAEKIKVLFPNQDNRGSHINISGVFVTKNAKTV